MTMAANTALEHRAPQEECEIRFAQCGQGDPSGSMFCPSTPEREQTKLAP